MLTDDVRQMLDRGYELTARITPMDPACNAWIGIFPFKAQIKTPNLEQNKLDKTIPWNYAIEVFEIPDHYDLDEYDDIPDHWVRWHVRGQVVASLKELESIVEKWLEDASVLKCVNADYPCPNL